MFFEPIESSLSGRDLLDIPRFPRTRYDDDRKSQGARGGNLRIGRIAAGILGHQHIDAFTLHQRAFGRLVERRAVTKGEDIRHGKHIANGLDGADQICMLWSRCEEPKFEAANREEYAARHVSKNAGSRIHGRSLDPMITVLLLPRRSAQTEKRHGGSRTGSSGIVRHDGREWMRRVDDGFDALILQKVSKPLDTPKTADAGWDGQRPRVAGATGQRQDRTEFGPSREPRRKRGGFRGTAQNENAHDPLFSEF